MVKNMSYVERNKNIKLEMASSTKLNIANATAANATSASIAKIGSAWKQVAHFVLDTTLIYSSVFAAQTLQQTFEQKTKAVSLNAAEPQVIAILFTIILLAMLNFKHFFSEVHKRRLIGDVTTVFTATMLSLAVLSALLVLVQPEANVMQFLFLFLLPVTVVALTSERIVTSMVRHQLWLRGVGVHNLVIVGATDAGVRLMRGAAENSRLGYKLVGFVDDQLRYSEWTLPVRYGSSIKRNNRPVPHLGQLDQLQNVLAAHEVDEVIVALPIENYQEVKEVIRQCHENDVACVLAPELTGLHTANFNIATVNNVPVLTSKTEAYLGGLIAKRLVDILGSLAVLTIAAPVMLIIAVLIKLDSAGPILFRQTRVGKNGETFNFYKFRSMYTNAEARLAELQQHSETDGATFKMKNDPRVTKVGRFIRRYSLDELPQLFNILMGQMTLVGPRPGLPREVIRYQPWQHRRLEVTPGLTGLWQVSGRSDIKFDEMVKLDIYYIEHWSLMLDIKILIKTVKTVLGCEGAY